MLEEMGGVVDLKNNEWDVPDSDLNFIETETTIMIEKLFIQIN